jgi:hypothetical protein
MNTMLTRSGIPACASTGPAFFSTGNVSPVSTAWLTKKSLASSTIPSAGIRLPAESSMMSPGTISSAGIGCGLPSRSAVALMVTWARNSSTAWLAVYSCAKVSTALAATMATTIAASVHSPAMADTTAAKTRMSTSGLVKWTVSHPTTNWPRMAWLSERRATASHNGPLSWPRIQDSSRNERTSGEWRCNTSSVR